MRAFAMKARAMEARGFTLLEILVAVAVLGMLLVLLNQGVSFGLRATAMQARLDGGGDLPAVDAALRGLIADADAGIYPEPASLKGTASSVSLLTEMPGPDGVRQRVDATIYASGGQLRLRWARHRHVQWFGPAPPAQEMTLLSGVSGLQIGYFAGASGAWQASWGADTLPALVRLQIVFEAAARHWPPIVVAPRLEALGQ